jgi:flagellar hook-associated protein 2
MATSSIVSTLGAGSGIDVKALAEGLVDAERKPLKDRIEAKISKTEHFGASLCWVGKS